MNLALEPQGKAHEPWVFVAGLDELVGVDGTKVKSGSDKLRMSCDSLLPPKGRLFDDWRHDINPNASSVRKAVRISDARRSKLEKR